MKQFFNPKSVALIGATDRKKSVGRALSLNILKGSQKVYFVNPNKDKIFNKNCFNKFSDIKDKVDLAIIAVPAQIVIDIVKDIIKKGVGGVIIISAGFKEVGNNKRQNKLSEILAKSDIDFIGPNSLGVITPGVFNGSFAPDTPEKGSIAFLSQSGALVDSVIDQSFLKDYGFSHLVSYGNGADLNLCDFLDFLDGDKKTKSIAIYLESLKNGRKFIKKAQKIKTPIVVLKGGQTRSGSKAANSHTGSLAGKSQIYSAGFKKAGIFEVKSVDDLFISARALSLQPLFKGKLGVVTNGGAVGVMAADWADKKDIKLAKINNKIKQKIKKYFNKNVNVQNPLDILGDALAKDYKKASELMLSISDALAVFFTPQMMTDIKKNSDMLVNLNKKFPKKTIVVGLVGGKNVLKGSNVLKENNIPYFFSPKNVILALKALKK